MVASLGKALGQLGHDVTIVTPLYRGIDGYLSRSPTQWIRHSAFPWAGVNVPAEFWSRQAAPKETVIFVGQPAYYDRPTLYTQNGTDYPDNAERFIFFSKAVAALALEAQPAFDIVHVHDWQTALVPLLLKYERERAGRGNGTRTCVTIHNLAYQGVFPSSTFALTGLPPSWFNMDTAEFYGQMNSLKAGIAAADVITTVSPRYAREITTEEFGCGLDGLLRSRQAVLHGILNGVDYDEWTTTRNSSLAASYTPANLQGKRTNKLALQRELGLEVAADQPLFGSVTRLVDQKGVDLILGALEQMLDDRMQFAMLGSGDPAYETAFKTLGGSLSGQGCGQNRLRHGALTSNRSGVGFLSDALPIRTLRSQPALQSALRNHSDRSCCRRFG